jgi:hypothetical protein
MPGLLPSRYAAKFESGKPAVRRKTTADDTETCQ